MKTKATTTIKWAASKKSYERSFFRAMAFILLVLSVCTVSFFGINPTTGAISVGFLVLMLFALQEANLDDAESDVNDMLNDCLAVQTSEGKPVLSYDENCQLKSVTLSSGEYADPKSYSNFGDSVYVANFETEEGWLIIVIEGEPHTKNQKAIAFRSVSEG